MNDGSCLESFVSLFITLAHGPLSFCTWTALLACTGSRKSSSVGSEVGFLLLLIIFRTAMFGTSCRLLPTSTPVFGSV